MAFEVTNNSICDVIRWLGEGHHVVIHFGAASSRCYHKCLGDAQKEGARVVNVYIHCSPGIFDEYITNAGYSECSCSLEGRVTIENNALNFMFKGRLSAL